MMDKAIGYNRIDWLFKCDILKPFADEFNVISHPSLGNS